MRKLYANLIVIFFSAAVPAMAQVEETSPVVINETPQGSLGSYYKTSVSATELWGSVIKQDVDGIATDIVFAEDGSVYIKDPFSTRTTGTWLKGTLEGDILTIKTPQPIYTREVDGETKVVYATRMVEQETADGKTLVEDREKDGIQFVRQDDRFVMTDDNPDLILGAAYEDGLWDNVGDKAITYGLQSDKPVEAPDAEPEKYTITTSDDSWFAYVVIKDGEVYIRGIFPQLPQAWIKGRVDGNSMTLSGAYLGVYDRYHVYFFGKDIDWELFEYVLKRDNIACSYDTETKTIVIKEEVMIDNGSKWITPLVTYSSGTKLEYVSPDVRPDRPQNPEILKFNEYSDSDGSGYVEFMLPKHDVNGNLLDVNKMYYNLFADDEKMTLYADDYGFADGKDITDIPYSYSDKSGIIAKKTQRGVYYYFTGFERLGIQSVYAEDGVEYKSDIVYNVPTGIRTTATDGNPVSTVYTDMAGRRTENPAKGLYIKSITGRDGSVKNMKVVVK